LLGGAQLQGASLDSARLRGTSLEYAQLQGTDFRNSTLAGMNISGATVWRTSFAAASLTKVLEDGLEANGLSKSEFATLQAAILKEVPEGGQREQALKRIEILNPDIFGPGASAREILEKGRVDETPYRSALAAQLKSLACSGDEDARYIVRGLWVNGRIEDTGAQAPGLVEAILNPACPVSATLTEADKAALKRKAKDATSAH
jgi:Pentapeptide repeats (8 copies)